MCQLEFCFLLCEVRRHAAVSATLRCAAVQLDVVLDLLLALLLEKHHFLHTCRTHAYHSSLYEQHAVVVILT